MDQKRYPVGTIAFGGAWLCDAVETGPDGSIRNIMGVLPEIAITDALPLPIAAKIVYTVMGPPGPCTVSFALTDPAGVVEFMGELHNEIPELPGVLKSSAPISLTLQDEGQYVLDVVVNRQQSIYRIPIFVRLENLGPSIH